MKKTLFYAVLIFLPWLLLEGFFRLLPVSSPPALLPVSGQQPLARHEPNVDYVFSKGWNFAIRTKLHTNNYGYNNVADYDPARRSSRSPLLMVIGDSYVEAREVDAGKSAAELLNAQLAGRGRVYSMGFSGGALPQYLAYAESARTSFHPDAMAFFIIDNDFDESLLKYKAEPGLHYFEELEGQLSPRRVDYALSPPKRVLRRSALVRYVVLNLSAGNTLKEIRRWLCRCGAPRSFREETDPAALEVRVKDSMRAVDYFFDQIPSKTGLAASAIVFVLDAIRPELYSPGSLAEAQTGYVAVMRRYFEEQAIARGYPVLDVQPAFMKRHDLDGSRFEFATDNHWNELGQQLVASEIAASPTFARVFRQ